MSRPSKNDRDERVMHRVRQHCQTPRDVAHGIRGLTGFACLAPVVWLAATTRLSNTPVQKEIFVTTKDASDDAGTPRTRSPIAAGMTLLGIYIAMYLAVAGVIRVLTSPDAAPVAPDSSIAHASVAAVSNPVVGAGDSRSHHDGEPSADGNPIYGPE